MEEARLNECKVEDITPEVFERLLSFIYNKGEIPLNFDQTCVDLYEAAHYYEIETLKKTCKQKIKNVLSAINAVKIFDVASRYELDDLKNSAWNVIKK